MFEYLSGMDKIIYLLNNLGRQIVKCEEFLQQKIQCNKSEIVIHVKYNLFLVLDVYKYWGDTVVSFGPKKWSCFILMKEWLVSPTGLGVLYCKPNKAWGTIFVSSHNDLVFCTYFTFINKTKPNQ